MAKSLHKPIGILKTLIEYEGIDWATIFNSTSYSTLDSNLSFHTWILFQTLKIIDLFAIK